MRSSRLLGLLVSTCKGPHDMQVWSLDVDAAEQQVAVGGVSPRLQLYRIHSDSETGGASSASKQVHNPLC